MKNITNLFLFLLIITVVVLFLMYQNLNKRYSDKQLEFTVKVDSIRHFKTQNGSLISEVQTYSKRYKELKTSSDVTEKTLFAYSKELGLKRKQIQRLLEIQFGIRDSMNGIKVDSIIKVDTITKQTYEVNTYEFKDSYLNAKVEVDECLNQFKLDYSYSDSLKLIWSNPLIPREFFLWRVFKLTKLGKKIVLDITFGNPKSSVVYSRDIILSK